MAVQHADLFHCLTCGRVAYEPHGGPAPDCCGQPMVRAVSDVVKEMPASTAADSETPCDVDEHALFAEVVELSQWCHRLPDVDIARSEELASRLSVLHLALLDQFEDPQHLGPADPAATSGTAAREIAEHVRGQGQRLLATFARLVGELRNGPLQFGNWVEVCDRLDDLVTQFRSYVQAERELTRVTSDGGRGPVANGHN
ncbi:MAG TPA: hypothetical protein VGP76_14215 [Planctomycetaceae bacterium]|jgi:hypothetical protein|nr:hypothetical protein [Planctomycetaceae bacterium]